MGGQQVASCLKVAFVHAMLLAVNPQDGAVLGALQLFAGNAKLEWTDWTRTARALLVLLPCAIPNTGIGLTTCRCQTAVGEAGA